MLDELKADIEKQPIIKPPGLTIVLVGDRQDSLIYVRSKIAACAKTGVKANFYQFPDTMTEPALLAFIDAQNNDTMIDGIMV